jgi:hypothetical protein
MSSGFRFNMTGIKISYNWTCHYRDYSQCASHLTRPFTIHRYSVTLCLECTDIIIHKLLLSPISHHQYLQPAHADMLPKSCNNSAILHRYVHHVTDPLTVVCLLSVHTSSHPPKDQCPEWTHPFSQPSSFHLSPAAAAAAPTNPICPLPRLLHPFQTQTCPFPSGSKQAAPDPHPPGRHSCPSRGEGLR